MTTTRGHMRAGFPILLLATLVAAAGCSDHLKLKPTRLSFDQFVNATVALRRAAAQTDSPAEFQVRKRELQSRLHFTDADLREFARVHANDIDVMSAAWDSVEARLERPDTSPAAPAATTPTVLKGSLTPPADSLRQRRPQNAPTPASSRPRPFY